MIRRIIGTILMAAVLLSLVACNETLTFNTDNGESEKVDTSNVYKGTTNDKAMKLLALESARQENKDKNVMISPLSVEMALGMALNGCNDAAKTKMETLLGASTDEINALYLAYMESKAADSENTADGEETERTEPLYIANSMWFNRSLGKSVDETFTSTLENNYKASTGYFTVGDENAIKEINNWVKEKTKGTIDSIVNDDSLSADILALLINTIYFNGKWSEPFHEQSVKQEDFTLQDGSTQQVDIMNGKVTEYYENSKATAFGKSYIEGYKFIGILPKSDEEIDITDLELDNLLRTRTSDYDVKIKIPKFEFDYSTSLVESLTNLGIGDLFTPGSMSKVVTDDGEDLGVSDIIHKTHIRMYENGTEASAVTSIGITRMSALVKQREEKQVYLDRTFVFLIVDEESNSILFTGVVNNPTI